MFQGIEVACGTGTDVTKMVEQACRKIANLEAREEKKKMPTHNFGTGLGGIANMLGMIGGNVGMAQQSNYGINVPSGDNPWLEPTYRYHNQMAKMRQQMQDTAASKMLEIADVSQKETLMRLIAETIKPKKTFLQELQQEVDAWLPKLQ